MVCGNVDNEVFAVGKHRGRTFEDVYRNEHGYVLWALRLDNPTGQMLSFCNYLRSMEPEQSLKQNEHILNKGFVGSCAKGAEGTGGIDNNGRDVCDSKIAANIGHTPHLEHATNPRTTHMQCYSKALDSCLEAKWKRLTSRLQVDELEERSMYKRSKMAEQLEYPNDIMADDSVTLQRVLESVVEAKKQQVPQTSQTTIRQHQVQPQQSRGNNVQDSHANQILDAFLYDDRHRRGGNDKSGSDISASSHPFQGDINKQHYISTESKIVTQVKEQNKVHMKVESQAVESTLTTDNSAVTGRTNLQMPQQKSTDDIKLNLEGVVALVLHSETEFYIAFNKPIKDKLTVWSPVVPPELFNFLRALDVEFIIKKDSKHSYIVFTADKYDVVLKALKNGLANCHCPVDPIPNFILRTFNAFSKYSKDREVSQKTIQTLKGVVCEYTKKNMARMADIIGHELYSQLKPFQREGVEFGIQKNGRVLIGDEMGLGKTLQALAISAFYCVDWPLLIVCPSSLRFQWRDQCIRWLPHLVTEEEICTIKTGKTDIPDNTKVVIISYDLFALNEHFRHAFRIVICDESHYLKNSRAKRTKCLVPLLRQTQRTILLSGTPTLNSASELFEQISCLLPAFCSSSTFIERYCEKKLNWYTKKMTYSGSKHADELHLFLVKTIMIRRLKENVLHELPPKIRSRVPIELPKAFLKEYSQYTDVVPNENELGDERHTSKMRQIFQMTGEAKTKGVCEYIVHLMKSDIKFIVFAHHIVVMDAIEQTLKDQKCKYIRIDGSTSQTKREEAVNRFQNQKDCTVALLSLTSCGVGLNLTASSTVIFAELYWVPGQIIQAEDRAHRIGTKHRTINVHYLIAEKSIEETIWKVINRKWKSVTATLNGETSNLVLVKEGEKEKLNERAKQFKIEELITSHHATA